MAIRSVADARDAELAGRSWLGYLRRAGPAMAANVYADLSYAAGIPAANYYASEPLAAAVLDEDKQFVIDRLWPVVLPLAQMVADSARDEASQAGYDSDRPMDANVEAFARGLLAGRANQWIVRLESDVTGALRRSERRADDTQDEQYQAVDEALKARKSDEADSWSRDFGNVVSNAVAVTVWGILAVVGMRWLTTGGESCPYCDSMNGRTVSHGQHFVDSSIGVVIEGLDALRPGSNVGHPPLRQGCDCIIVPI